jgi:DNA-binding transcriptional ArsR family regulator
MSKARNTSAAEVFFALGDPTRLSVVSRLGANTDAQSVTALSENAGVTRQAVAKHLRVLEGAGLVSHKKCGREVLYLLKPAGLNEAKAFLDAISMFWDGALERLRRQVELPVASGARRGSRRR